MLLYARTLFSGFTYLDDTVLILDNLPSLQNASYIFRSFMQGVIPALQESTPYYRPLLTVSLIPEAIIGGSLPFFYHLANVIIHIVAVCLVYTLFTKLKYAKRIALLLALIFLVHPALTQAVAWIPGRTDSLLAVFILASFNYFLGFVDEREQGQVVWSVLFFMLALFTKENAIVLPALCIGYLWLRGALTRTALGWFGAGWLLATAVYSLFRLNIMSNLTQLSVSGVVSSFLTNLPGTIPIVGKMFFPFDLSVLPIVQDMTFVWGYLALALLAGLTVLHVKDRQSTRRTQYMMLFGLAWFVLFLWPSFVRPDFSPTADFIEHRLYLPIIGLLIFLAETRVVRVLDEPAGEWLLAPWLFIVFVFFSITFVYEGVFSDRLTFWQNAASHSPHSALAQKNLGAMYYLDKNYALAEAYSRKALALNAEEPMAHNNLGLVYVARGRWAEAEQEYLQELAVNPYYDSAHFNLGLLYYGENDFTAAREHWEETLYINPDYLDARRALYVLDSQRK